MSFDVTLVGGMPWGFRIHGGIDCEKPVHISRVNPVSKASQAGLQEGDFIESINGQPTAQLQNREAHQLIKSTLDRLDLSIRRAKRKSEPLSTKMFRSSTNIEVNTPTSETPGDTSGETLTTIPQSPHSTTIILNPIHAGFKSSSRKSSEEVVVDGEPNGSIDKASTNEDSTSSGAPARQADFDATGNTSKNGHFSHPPSSESSFKPADSSFMDHPTTESTVRRSHTLNTEGVWTPGSSPTTPRTILKTVPKTEDTSEAGTIPSVWKPFGQGSSPEKHQFKSVKIDPSAYAKPSERIDTQENGTTYPPPPLFANTSPPEEDPCVAGIRPPPPVVPPKTLSFRQPDTIDTISTAPVIPSAYGSTVLTPDKSPPSFTRVNPSGTRLPTYQNPTITLLQKAREGQIPKGAVYIDHKMNSKEEQQPLSRTVGPGNWWEPQFAIKSEEVLDDRKVIQLEPVKFEGIGPVIKGIPIALCTGVKDENKAEWYKRMYKSLHRGQDSDGRMPYLSRGGYMSEPEPERDDDYYYRKYATLDRRKTRDNYYDSNLRNGKQPSVWSPPSARYSSDIYKNQPKKIEDYEPGHSSIAEMEAKLQGTRNNNPPVNRSSHGYMFKDGYESDSTLVYRKKGPHSSLSPNEQHAWYKEFQKGGDIPLTGFRRPAPEKPAGRCKTGAVSQLKHRYERLKDGASSYWTWRQSGPRGWKRTAAPATRWTWQKVGDDQYKPVFDDNQLWVLPGPSRSSPNLLVDLDSVAAAEDGAPRPPDRRRKWYYGSTPDCLDHLSDSSYSPEWGWSSGFAVHNRTRHPRIPDLTLFSPRKYDKDRHHYKKLSFGRMCRSVEDFRRIVGPSRENDGWQGRGGRTWPEYLRNHSGSVTGLVQAGIARFENGDLSPLPPLVSMQDDHRSRAYTYSPLITSTPLPSPRMLSSPSPRPQREPPPRPSVAPGYRNPPVSPPPRRRFSPRRLPNKKEPPHRYQASEVNIHYRSPIQNLEKEYVNEDEIRRRQEQMMKEFYEEEKHKKAMQELADIESRRHSDNFIPSQKSPIPLNRYDNLFEERPQSPLRARTPEPKTAAKALYNFTAQSAKELSFNKGDIIFIHRKIDKNWYEGEHHGLIGLFPVNHVEIIPYDSARLTAKKATEGQARAKYNFQAQTPMELSLVKGEHVILTRKVDSNWYEGRIGSLKGIFPTSYIDVLVEPGIDLQGMRHSPVSKPVASPVSHSLIMNGSSVSPKYNSVPNSQSAYCQRIEMCSTNPYATMRRYGPTRPPEPWFEDKKHPLNETLHIQTQSDPIPRYRALYAYKPQNDDELELREGDTVYVMEKCDDGWYVGSSQRTGLFGTFPGNYVERI